MRKIDLAHIGDKYGRFVQISSRDEVEGLLELRRRAYSGAGIGGGETDRWDFSDCTRYFAVLDGKGEMEKAVRIIERTRELGLPCELNLNSDSLTSTEQQRLKELIGPYNPQRKIIEISGFVGDHKTRGSIFTLMGGVMGVEEKDERETGRGWDLLLQVQHPRHVKAYTKILDAYGLPFEHGFEDHLDRPAMLLSLSKKDYEAWLGRTDAGEG